MNETLLCAKDLGCRFRDGVWAFRHINLTISKGQLTVLAGRNGSGKTILAKHLAGLHQAIEGKLFWKEESFPQKRQNPSSLIGYVFQDVRLQTVGETVYEDLRFGPSNLGFSPTEIEERVESAMTLCGLKEKKQAFVHSLSGGEMRKLAIAGVLALKPQLIILDEPFANLDPEGVVELIHIIEELLSSRQSLILITHEIEKILGLADSLLVMDKGELVFSGHPQELFSCRIEKYGLRNPFSLGKGDYRELVWR